jgi:hypothetical protein
MKSKKKKQKHSPFHITKSNICFFDSAKVKVIIAYVDF